MTRLSRRRFISIAAAAGGAALLGAAPVRAAHEWRGVALGAPASLRLVGLERAEARRLVAAALAEVERLERIFSLYRPHSALARLNAAGRLAHPPHDLVALLDVCRHVHAVSGGAFDPTVQPLWRVMAAHFARPGADPAGPPRHRLEAARRLVGFDGVAVSSAEVSFARAGMALTLNGIAQGWITDRVAERLRREGLRDVLVAMGEIRVHGRRPDGAPWRVGIEGRSETLTLAEGAVATSSAAGTRFAPGLHHLFDPATGASAPERSVTVTAANATLADAASTALAVLPPARWGMVARALGVRLV